jgi:hypothetical protein
VKLTFDFMKQFSMFAALAAASGGSAPSRQTMNRNRSGWMVGVAWAGVVFSVFLMGAAVWFHFTLDPIMRIPFVVLFGGAGVMIGLTSLGYVIRGNR